MCTRAMKIKFDRIYSILHKLAKDYLIPFLMSMYVASFVYYFAVLFFFFFLICQSDLTYEPLLYLFLIVNKR